MSRYREWDLSCKVYVGNLGSSASKHEIESAFTKYGPLKNVWVARNPPGFAFVEFEDPRDAKDAVRGLDGVRCCGTDITVEMSTGRSRRGAGNNGGSRRARPRYSRSRSRSPYNKVSSRYLRGVAKEIDGKYVQCNAAQIVATEHAKAQNCRADPNKQTNNSRSRSRSPRRRSFSQSRSRDRRSRSDSRDRR